MEIDVAAHEWTSKRLLRMWSGEWTAERFHVQVSIANILTSTEPDALENYIATQALARRVPSEERRLTKAATGTRTV